MSGRELTLKESEGICVCFREGLARVAKPIQNNPNYKDILGDRVDTFFGRFIGDDPDSVISPPRTLAVLDRSLRSKQPTIHVIPPRAAVAYGATRNNLREFSFLRDFLARNHGDSSIFNTGLLPAVPSDRTPEERLAVANVRTQFLDYLNTERSLSKPALFQLINYSHAYLNWFRTLRLSGESPRVLVLANDHSPNQVACSMVAKELGIPRIYIQHAEVTAAFPPLDFDISILRNQASLRTYERIGAMSGEAYVVSRESTTFASDRFARATSGPISIGIYLTAQVDWDGLREVVAALKSNSKVHSLFIKPHPSQPMRKVTEACPSVPIVSEVPETPHIAVVANSSVVVELLHRGNPVFQFYGMDTVPADYYGFSRQGIAPQVDLQDLRAEFWSSFVAGDAWLDAYQLYDPTADPGHKAEESRLALALARHFPSRGGNPGIAFSTGSSDEEASTFPPVAMRSTDDFCRQALALAPNTLIDLINEPERYRSASWSPSILALDFAGASESLFVERAPNAYDVFAAARGIRHVRSEFVFNGKRRDIELSGRSTAEHELDEMFSYIQSRSANTPQLWRLQVQFLLFLIRLKQDQRIAQLFSQAPDFPIHKLHVNHRIAVVRWLRERPLMQAALGLSAADFYEGLSPFHRLKLKILSSTEAMFEESPWTHEEIEDALISTASRGVAKDFATIFKPGYEKLREKLVYMDVRWSKQECDAFFQEVETALRNGEPFSLVRLSDGEGYIYGDGTGYLSISDMKNRERHWWREELPEHLRATLLPQIRTAAENADVLGIPCVYRFLRDTTEKTPGLLHYLQGRGLAEVLVNVAAGARDNQRYTEEKCNLPLFRDIERINDLARECADRIIVVASATEDEVTRLFSPDIAFRYISIPTHSRTTGNGKYVTHERTLPHMYADIRDQVRATVRPRDLVLIAAGVIGKIFVDDAKRSGGVALDIGSSLDEWVDAGIHSLH